MTIKNIGIAALVLAAILGVLGFLGIGLHAPVKLGSSGNAAETYYNSQWLVGGNQIGPTGTLNANQQFGTCNPTFYGTSLAATSTGTFACAVPGILAGDTIVADPPIGSNVSGAGFVIQNAYATTTGIVAFTYVNLTGAATTSFKQATTSVEYVSWR